MNTDILISVAVLCYNHEKLLPRSLKFFQEQTKKEYELILVDNQSTDHSYDILLEFKNENPTMNIKVIRNNSSKVCEGRRCGLEAASGKYIMFHDGDDWLETSCIEQYINKLEESGYPDCVIGTTKSVDDKGQIYSVGEIIKPSSVWMKNTLQAFLIKKEIILKCGNPFIDTFFEDFYACMCIKPYISSVGYLNKPLYNYYCNTNSASMNPNVKKVEFWPVKFEDLFLKIKPILDEIDDQSNRVLAEYQLLRHYYSCVFAGGNLLSLKDKLKLYRMLKNVMDTYYPDYLSNQNVKLFAQNYYCGSFKRNIWLSVQLEKMDKIFHTYLFMDVLLSVYHLFLKIHLYKRRH